MRGFQYLFEGNLIQSVFQGLEQFVKVNVLSWIFGLNGTWFFKEKLTDFDFGFSVILAFFFTDVWFFSIGYWINRSINFGSKIGLGHIRCKRRTSCY
jgi:hypothetical protein